MPDEWFEYIHRTHGKPTLRYRVDRRLNVAVIGAAVAGLIAGTLLTYALLVIV